jgi:hypothetical protein
MIDENEKAAPVRAGSGQERKRKHERTTETYHGCKWSATTMRAENSLAGRSARLDPKSRSVVTNRAQRSHSSVLIAIAAGIAARMVR